VHNPIPAALVTIALVASVALTGLLFESAQQAVARASKPLLPVPEYERPPLDREWIYDRPAIDSGDIVRKGAETRSLDHMWRKR
jgi:hypothetical protein